MGGGDDGICQVRQGHEGCEGIGLHGKACGNLDMTDMAVEIAGNKGWKGDVQFLNGKSFEEIGNKREKVVL